MRSPSFHWPRFFKSSTRSKRLSTFRLPPNVAAARRLRCCDINIKSGVNGLCCFSPRFGANGVFTTSPPKSQSLNVLIKKGPKSHYLSFCVRTHTVCGPIHGRGAKCQLNQTANGTQPLGGIPRSGRRYICKSLNINMLLLCPNSSQTTK